MSEGKEWSRPLAQRITVSNEKGADFAAREDDMRVRRLIENCFPVHGSPLNEFYECLQFARCYLLIKDPESGEYLKASFGQKDLDFPFVIHDVAALREILSKFFHIKNSGEHYEEYSWLSHSGFFRSVFSSATPQDFLYPEQLFRRWINLLKDNPFEGKKEGMDLLSGNRLKVTQRLSSFGQESPYELCYDFSDGEKKDIDFPSVRYGKTADKELTIFSVQDKNYLGISKTVIKRYEESSDIEEKYKQFFHEIALLRNKYRETAEFSRETLNFDAYKDPYEWVVHFFDSKETKDLAARNIFHSIFDGSPNSWVHYAKSKRAKKMYSQRVRERHKIFSKMDLDDKVISPHMLSFVTTLFYGAKEGLLNVVVPAYYPRREHREKDNKRSHIDWSIFEQTRKMVLFACENIEGITLLSEPDIDSCYRLKIDRDNLRCPEYPCIEDLLQKVLGDEQP